MQKYTVCRRTFEDWYKTFITRFGGEKKNTIGSWLDKVNQCHQNVRNQIGGVNYRIHLSLSTSQEAATGEKVSELIDSLWFNIAPWCSNHHPVISKSDLYYRTLPSGIKTSKVVNSVVTKMVRPFKDDLSDGLNVFKRKIDKDLSLLGEEWAKCRTTSVELTVDVLTSPESFVTLGHFGPDAKSCFRQGGGAPSDKYYFAQFDDTFVVLILDKHENALVRMLGHWDRQRNAVSFFNAYLQPGFWPGNVYAVMKKISANITGCDESCINEYYGLISVDSENFYLNDGVWQYTYTTSINPKFIYIGGSDLVRMK